MREYIYFLEMSNCKRQSRAKSFLQIENRIKEQHSKLAVNKSSGATWFLSPFIRQAKIEIFLLQNDFPSWKLPVISLNFEDSSATNKAYSRVASIFQHPLTKAGNLHVYLWRRWWRDTKIKNILWLGKFQRVYLAQTGSWKWNQKCDWLISVKGMWFGCEQLFLWGSIAWDPKNGCEGDYRFVHLRKNSLPVSEVTRKLIQTYYVLTM